MYSKFSSYNLRRTLRDIERSIVKSLERISKLEDVELKAHLKASSLENDADESKDDTTNSKSEMLRPRIYGKKSFLSDLFEGTKLRGDLLSA